ncbi:MAG: SGNH/GDSL hydrolase family protein [bacterium]|nr:SGNH/GDSL hydrolase family protein [bacterium]
MRYFILILLSLAITGCGSIGETLLQDVVTNDYDSFVNQTYIPEGYSFTTPNSMLVLGNSIALIPDFGYGASASSIDKDYVHVLADLISTNVTARNCWDIERSYKDFDFSVLPTADLIVIQIGDNIENGGPNYGYSLARLIDNYPGKDIVLVSTLLKSPDGNKSINNQIKQVAMQRNLPFIDARMVLWGDAENMGDLNHPSDAGMAAIAQTIFDTLCEI